MSLFQNFTERHCSLQVWPHPTASCVRPGASGVALDGPLQAVSDCRRGWRGQSDSAATQLQQSQQLGKLHPNSSAGRRQIDAEQSFTEEVVNNLVPMLWFHCHFEIAI